jgi:hypothetical protein
MVIKDRERRSRARDKLCATLPEGNEEWISWTARGVAYLSYFMVTAAFLYHVVTNSPAYLGLLEDDYFYYATVADNLVRFGRFTYDGVTLTNGFHPLWQLVLTVLRFVCGRFGPAYYTCLEIISVIAGIITYELGTKFARELGLPRGMAEVVSAMYSVGTALLMSMGMEAVIAVPLLLWLFVAAASSQAITMKRAAKLGFIASLAVLARLDIAIAVGLLIAGFLFFVRPRPPEAFRLLASFGTGGLLLPTYLVANLWAFNTLLPVSAMAKQIYSGIGFSLSYVRSVAVGTVYGPTVGVLLPAGAIALILLARKTTPSWSPKHFVGGTALTFAFVLWGLNALSGWIFFGWYAYPILTASIASAAFIWEEWSWVVATNRAILLSIVIVILALPVVAATRYYIQHGPGWSVSDNSLLAASYDIAARMRGREGVYAMGAVAGVVGYVMDHPLVQLEGIMADRRMVNHVSNESPLEDVLRENKVDYLIVSFASKRVREEHDCYEVTQPHAEWAGQRTKKMRGEICSPPILRFVTSAGTNSWSVFPAIETLIWNVRDAHWVSSP